MIGLSLLEPEMEVIRSASESSASESGKCPSER